MLDHVDYDDTDSPAIGLVPAGASWADVQDHIKISHGPLLVRLDGDPEYAGLYWTGTEAVIVTELGPDPDNAIDEFRAVLRDRGEA